MNRIATPPPTPIDLQDQVRQAVQLAVAKLGSQRALADRCGVTASMVSQWLNKHRPVSSEHANLLSQLSGIPRETLFPKLFALAEPEGGGADTVGTAPEKSEAA